MWFHEGVRGVPPLFQGRSIRLREPQSSAGTKQVRKLRDFSTTVNACIVYKRALQRGKTFSFSLFITYGSDSLKCKLY